VTHPAHHARGAVPRDFAVDPPTMFDPPTGIVLTPRSDWSRIIADKVAGRMQTSDHLLAANIPSTDQNGHGYCWAYSTVGCVIAYRCLSNIPYVKLNPHAVAAIIKGGRDEGGWCGLSAKFLRENGVPAADFWPGHSRDLRHDTPTCRANMKLHKVTEEWVDLNRAVYDQNLTFEQVASCLLANINCALDFNHWGHSVHGCDLVDGGAQRKVTRVASGKLASLKEFESLWGMKNPVTQGYGVRLRNSWTDAWGNLGFGILTGGKAIPDGALAIRVAGASDK